MNDPFPAAPEASGASPPNRRSSGMLVLCAVSIGISLLVFGASASNSVASLDGKGPATGERPDASPSGSERSVDRKRADDVHRRQARERDEKLLQAVRQRVARPTDGRDRRSVRAEWERQVDEIRQQLRGVEEFPPGSIVWHRREALQHLMEDEPPRD